jgi:group I intron endonuclease
MIGIYKITSPSGKVYIGQSINIEKRFKYYKCLTKSLKKQLLLYNSFCKHGVENHKFEIVHELTKGTEQSILNQHEILYWKEYKNRGFKMLNIRDAGGSKGKPSEDTKKKMSIANKGKGGRISFLGKNHTKKTKMLMRLAQEGKPKSKQHCKNMSISQIGLRNKPILQFDLNGNFIKEWASIKEAGDTLKLSKGNISSCANGFLKRVNKFKWTFKPI